MARIIAVCGAGGGGMGGGVADRMLKQTGWTVRAVTRNIASEKALSLKSRGAEVVYATYDDIDSMTKAFEQLKFPPLEHFILHALPSGEKVAGKGHVVPHTDSKDRAVDEIKRALPDLAKKSTFMAVGMFSQNLWTRPFLKPFELPTTKGKYAWLLPISRDTKASFAGDAYYNVGVFVHAILSHPKVTLPAKWVLVATDEITMPEALAEWSDVTGKPAHFATLSLDGFTELFGPFGQEVGLQYQMHDVQPDMMKPYRADFVTMEELGIEKGDLVGHKQALEKNADKLLL